MRDKQCSGNFQPNQEHMVRGEKSQVMLKKNQTRHNKTKQKQIMKPKWQVDQLKWEYSRLCRMECVRCTSVAL